ncbi:MAG: thioesterase family protein [Halopseudomonas sp.]|uniref:acyl-CoA thioesterase n=1 Tax=Halopseudomonas sp. TaxID=2901191 RepID=UPI003001F99C
MNFSALLAAFASSSDQSVTIPADWAQGRAGYGGLVAALVVAGMRKKVAEGRPVRSLAITFVGPVTPGASMTVEAELLREGRAVSQVLGRAVQNGQTMCIIQGSFGAGRESSVDVSAEPGPSAPAPESCQRMPFIEGLNPPFIRYFDVRWTFGDYPCTNSRKREMGGWMRFDEEFENFDAVHLVGLVDVWPPAVLPHLKERAPASSLTWTIEFVQPQPDLGDGWMLYRANIEHARDGYGHIAAMIWSRAGELVAISRQTVAVFG